MHAAVSPALSIGETSIVYSTGEFISSGRPPPPQSGQVIAKKLEALIAAAFGTGTSISTGHGAGDETSLLADFKPQPPKHRLEPGAAWANPHAYRGCPTGQSARDRPLGVFDEQEPA